ncbi:hypothetical protein A7C91_09260 [Thermococcus piezophilus]|uniref:PIN domain-containing protein n=1 Tax=Thermococcus piezophilus TaxID=1712654 RepID=A0A172WJJ7_9EURY|nr:hypothetical protein A7C91_09260 [Thermococcus piezophilus]
MIVIDASAIAKYILKEEGWEHLEQYLAMGPVSVDHALLEVTNAVWKHFVLYEWVDKEIAEKMFRAIDLLPNVIPFERFQGYLKEAREIAVECRISVYDSLYISQARKYGTLLTSDKKQGKIAEGLGINVIFI